jgi:hypothetical protein
MPMALPTVHSMLPAMIVMVVPAFLVCAGIAYLAYRRRHQSTDR